MFFCQMLKLWYLDDTFEKSYDKMKIMIELEFFIMKPLLLKGLQRYFPTTCELSLDVKMKHWYFGEKQKNLKTETGTLFETKL